jgi:PAS domain S-box-containing protein
VGGAIVNRPTAASGGALLSSVALSAGTAAAQTSEAGAAAVPWWAWLAAALAGGMAAALVIAVWRLRTLATALGAQRSREVALKTRFDDVVERTSEIVIQHDHHGRISTINRAGEQVTGYARGELRVLDPGWIVSQDYLDVVADLLAHGAGALPRSFRAELLQRKGGRVPVEVQARVIIEAGRVIGVTSIARDLSERDRLESELRQAQKMEAVGRLATGIAHDFNNLITVLLGYSDELIERLPPQSEWRKPAEEIRRAAERASGLTQQLLAFSRRQANVPQIIDINLTVSNMEDLLRRLLGTDVTLEFNLDPALGHIHADPAQIGQVVMNLAVNARDAMPKGGTLAIETANVQLGDEHLEVIPGPHVMLAVRDTGVGMSPEVQKRLFEPFFTTKGGQGTGIGLSMVQAIVRQSGGHMTVESEEGRGSVFRAYFPRVTDAPAPATPRVTTPPAMQASGVVLLAEDDDAVRRLVVNELLRRGFTVLEARDGREAADVAEAHQGPIDVLVSDIVMPRMGGVELAEALAGQRPEMRVLFISGHPDRAEGKTDPTERTNLLMKPFTADTLAARITELMESPHG